MKHIVILGGGYAGASAAVELHGIKAQVTLVNHHSYHHLTTLLHQPVVGRREYRDLSLPLRDVLPKPVRFLRGRVRQIVPRENRIEIQTREGRQSLVCDIMVIALGWQPQFYDIPGLRQYGLTLDSLNASRTAIYLQEKQVECLANTRIAEGLPDGVLLSDGTKIQAGVVIWTGGVRSNILVQESGLEVNRDGRAIVNEFLQAKGYDNIFVLGDCAAPTGADGNILPPTAQLAVAAFATAATLLVLKVRPASLGIAMAAAFLWIFLVGLSGWCLGCIGRPTYWQLRILEHSCPWQ